MLRSEHEPAISDIRSSSFSHLLLDTLDLHPQLLDHPVELHDLILGALQIIPVSAGRGLQLP